ncbi:hypothetical protein [Actinotalea sp. Marseille-Q4924]|uniref:AAA family ATPase n=1 Tax=Actinotalea sp. Marseille-Q4924 TaxID=2866571 RepID=UPI001CE4649D|nr:hypothetical protein [Actinotalea sp. Marseille-Q4924]
MTVGVLCALRGDVETAVVRHLDGAVGLEVTRRCADLAELLASGAAGVGGVAVVASSLAGLDREVVRHLQGSQVHVVLVDLGSLPGEPDAAALGADLVLGTDALDDLVGQLRALLADGERTGRRPGEVAGSARLAAAVATGPAGTGSTAPVTAQARPGGADGPVPGAPGAASTTLLPAGAVVAVWGPAGAPGRTTTAVSLAAELASRSPVPGEEVLLVDADTYGGAVGAVLGLLDEAPGLAAAVRAATGGHLDVVTLAGLTPLVHDGLRVLTGISRAARWPEISDAGLEVLWPACRRLARTTVVDTGFCLEEDEVLSYDTRAPRRNAATLSALTAADVVMVVGAGDPLGLQRLVRGLADLAEAPATSACRRVVVVNRVRPGTAGPRPAEAVRDALRRYAGVEDVHVLPDEPAVCDAALLSGRSIVEHAPGSSLRRAVARLADDVLAVVAPVGAH